MFHPRSGEFAADPLPPRPVDPAGEVLRQIGAALRETRTRHGLDLHAVADELRIKAAYLQALEEGDLSAIPGRPYALGFLRGYAIFLGLDGDDLVRRFKAAERGVSARAELSVPTPVAESRVPKVQLLALSLFLVGLLYGGWHYINADGRPADEAVTEVPEELREAPEHDLAQALPPSADPVRAFAGERSVFLPPAEDDADDGPAAAPVRSEVGEASAAETTARSVDGEVDTSTGRAAAAEVEWSAGEPGDADALTNGDVERAVTTMLMEDLPLTPETSAGAANPPSDATPAEPGRSARELLAGLDAAVPNGAREGRVYGRTGGEARVRLEALEPSWIQVRSADGSYIYTRTLQPGDVYLVPERTDLALWTGNAGGLRVVVDGRNLAPLGRAGEVRRDIPLNPERLLAGR